MPAPGAILMGSTALMATGAGIVIAQGNVQAANTALSVLGGILGGGGLLGVAKLWIDYRTNKDRVDRQIADIKAEAEKKLVDAQHQIEVLQKEIDDGSEDRKKMREKYDVERDMFIIQVQDLKLGEEWYRLQLGIATGKAVPPKPPLFTAEADKVMGDSGIFPSVGGMVPPGYDVLIVDDSASSIVQLKRLLKLYGFVVRSASSVSQAIHHIKERRPDIVMTDLLMPGHNGTELVRSIRGEGDMKTRIIVLTAYAETPLIAEAQTLGADSVLYKPYDPQRLIEMIRPMDGVDDASEYGV